MRSKISIVSAIQQVRGWAARLRPQSRSLPA
jgi:hypothetical protein